MALLSGDGPFLASAEHLELALVSMLSRGEVHEVHEVGMR